MHHTAAGLPGARFERAVRRADKLQIGDFLHDALAPVVIAGFEDAPPHLVVIVGRLACGTDMRVRYLAGRPVDSTRLVRDTPPPAPSRRRHLSLVPPLEGGAQ